MLPETVLCVFRIQGMELGFGIGKGAKHVTLCPPGYARGQAPRVFQHPVAQPVTAAGTVQG